MSPVNEKCSGNLFLEYRCYLPLPLAEGSARAVLLGNQAARSGAVQLHFHATRHRLLFHSLLPSPPVPPTTRYDYFSSAPPHHYIPGLQLPLPAVIFHARFLPVCSPAHLHCSCALCLGGEYMQCAECNKYIFIFLAGDLLFFFFFFPST